MKKEYKVYYSGKDFEGEGTYNIENGTLKMLKGSRITKNEVDSYRKSYPPRAIEKDELIDNGIIVDYEFIQDYVFEKTFHASTILSSYGTAGNKAWKTMEGKTIDEIIEGLKNIDIFKDYYNNYNTDRKFEEVKML